MKPFAELIKLRQSTREYTNKPVEREKIIQCLQAARLAPSANNSQPWKFVVVDEPQLKDQVADCTASLGMNKFTFQAPVLVWWCRIRKTYGRRWGLVKTRCLSLRRGMAVNQFACKLRGWGWALVLAGLRKRKSKVC